MKTHNPHLSGVFFFCLSLLCLWASTATQLSAQTKVEKYTVSTGRRGGLLYHLPRTYIQLRVHYDVVTERAGELARFAAQEIGEKQVISQDRRYYELAMVELLPYGVADPENAYMIRFKDGTVAPYVYLTEDGVLCAVNRAYPAESTSVTAIVRQGETIYSRADGILPAEYIQATTLARKAKIAGRELFLTRDNKMNVISGELEQAFPDGAAMQLAVSKLERREGYLRQLFTGYAHREERVKTFSGFCADSAYQVVAFRFSPELGPLPADDLSGEPVYLKTEVLESAPSLTEREQEKQERSLKGLVYMEPGSMQLSLVYRGKEIATEKIAVAQLGRKIALAPVLFDTRRGGTVRVLLYPASGALREISEEEATP